MKKINWLDHLVNLIVVIAGISIAFAMNNWKAGNDQKRIEKEYFRSFVVDLEYDITNLDSLLSDDSIQLNAMIKILSFTKEDNLNELGLLTDSMALAINRLALLNTLRSQNTTYESMKSSGKLEVLADFDLKMDILNHYHNTYNSLNEIEEYYKNNFDNNLLPYFVENFSRFSSDPASILTELKFNTLIQIHAGLLQQRIGASQNCLKSSMELKNQLSNKLSNF